jgi:homoprotocatechuate degradation regulator HpaR
MAVVRPPQVRAAPRRKAEDEPGMPPFRRSLPMLLLWAREAVMQRFRPAIYAHGLTDQQWRIVRALAEVESLEIHALGKNCCIHPASLSRILPNMSRLGLITRRSNKADQRRVVVSITPKGRALLEKTSPISGRIYAELARDIGPERLELAYQVLEEIIVALEARKQSCKIAGADDLVPEDPLESTAPPPDVSRGPGRAPER